MVKLSNNRLKLSSGKIIKFKSAKKRANYEKYAHTIKAGWKPKRK